MKRRFVFRLARLLRVRAIEESIARAEWSRAEVEARVAEQRREEHVRQIARARSDLARALAPCTGPLQPRAVLRAHDGLGSLEAALRRSHEDARTRRAQAEGLATAWRERERDRRVLTELRDRARARHVEELEQEESAQLDEQALVRRAFRARMQDREGDSSSTDPATDHWRRPPDPR